MRAITAVGGILLGGGAFVSLARAQPVDPALLPSASIWQNFQFGGFFSQGFLASSANDYLGETSHGTFDFREYGLNASYATGRWRFGAQVFGQKLGAYGNDNIKLDWAMVDYQPVQWLGFRAGRVKMPRGLYNEALDLDSVRPFVLLPQSIYDNRVRDFNASFDGAMIYGNVGLKRFGSLDYTLYYGDTPLKVGSGASDFFNTEVQFKNVTISLGSLDGGTLFWNTPINGLRVGYSRTTYNNLSVLHHVVIPAYFIDIFEPKSTKHYHHNQFSVEYLWAGWTLAAEVAREKAYYFVDHTHTYHLSANADLFYFSATRRINSWLEVGAYHSVSREHFEHDTPAPTTPLREQNDTALSFRFDLNEHMIFKLEGHYMDGIGKIYDTPEHPNPPATLDPSWTMIAAKVTFSF